MCLCVSYRVVLCSFIRCQTGQMTAEEHCLSLLDDWALSGRSWMQISNHRWSAALCDGGRGGYRGLGRRCVFLLVCNPGSGICQLRTNGGISWGTSWPFAKQHCYQQRAWLSFRGHKQDTASAEQAWGFVTAAALSSCHLPQLTLSHPLWKVINYAFQAFKQFKSHSIELIFFSPHISNELKLNQIKVGMNVSFIFSFRVTISAAAAVFLSIAIRKWCVEKPAVFNCSLGDVQNYPLPKIYLYQLSQLVLFVRLERGPGLRKGVDKWSRHVQAMDNRLCHNYGFKEQHTRMRWWVTLLSDGQ